MRLIKLTFAQINYLESQLIGRIATAGADGRARVVPTTFNYNYELGAIDLGGHHVLTTKRFTDVEETAWAALVVDDLVSIDPWRPRMLEIRGHAEALPTGGTGLGRVVEAGIKPNFGDAFIRLWPERIHSIGLD